MESSPGLNALRRRWAWRRLGVGLALGSMIGALAGAEVVRVTVDFSQTNGILRGLHGVNRGPLVAGGLIDLTEQHRELEIPFTRLHDSHWPNSDVVDIHAVFPDFSRDPAKPESFDFVRTDEYLAAVQRSGAQFVYRLGESIEHDIIKRFVHPPSDPSKWAQICLGIIRHYNEGWASGFRYNIRYWEIWNEPENRPVMWTGTDAQFLDLYAHAARAIKTRHPQLKVGGPGFGYTGQVVGGQFRAGGLLTNFLARCQRDSLPLDFLSWHCYSDDPDELVVRAHGIRKLLDAYGFKNAESHLNEWNYLPGRTWQPISRSSSTPHSRQRFYAEMSGPSGAAFITAALIKLQDAPIDMANLFHAETGPFGLFDEHGVPQKTFYAMKAFNTFLKTPRRLAGLEPLPITLAAGMNSSGTEIAILLTNRDRPQAEWSIQCTNLPWRRTRGSIQVVDAVHDLADLPGAIVTPDGSISLTLRRPSVALISLRAE